MSDAHSSELSLASFEELSPASSKVSSIWDELDYRPGDRVQIHDLSDSEGEEMNGKEGDVVDYDEDAKAFIVDYSFTGNDRGEEAAV